jgi:uncharacterized membrane protein
MKPLIDPEIFYWMDVCENLKILIAFFLVISICALLGFILFWIFSDDPWKSEEDKEKLDIKCKKWIIRLSIISVVSTLSLIFIPSKETMYTMLIVNNLTEDNLSKGKEEVKELIDYTVEKLNEVKTDKGQDPH